MNRYILYAIAVCCILAAAGGCRFHRTGRGFIVRSQWALECENVPRLSFATEREEAPAVEQSSAKPQRLRWRLRQRGYQLASRLFGRGGYAYQNTHPFIEKGDGPGDEARSVPSAQAAGLRYPEGSSDLPDSRRPDLVVD